MRIKMITLACGPAGNFVPGDERTVSEIEGRQLVDGKYAVDITPRLPPEKATASAGETASVTTAETSTMQPPSQRSRGRK